MTTGVRGSRSAARFGMTFDKIHGSMEKSAQGMRMHQVNLNDDLYREAEQRAAWRLALQTSTTMLPTYLCTICKLTRVI